MRQINDYITEKFKINSKTVKSNNYTCQPQTRTELIETLEKRLKEDKNANLNDIDISKVWDMSSLFSESATNLDPHNIDISEWDVSHVKNMRSMFYDCENFNCDLSKWDVSNVKDMSMMFYGCESFDSDLSKWDVSNVNSSNIVFGGPKWGKCTKMKEEHKPKFIDN